MKNNNYPNWLISLEIAQELKAIGFVVPCSFYFDEKLLKISPWHDEEFVVTNWNDKLFRYCVSIPTWEQVFEWFREKGFESHIGVQSLPYPDEGVYYYFEISKPTLYSINQLYSRGEIDNYEEAREALVKALIQTYKNEQL